MQCSLLDQIQSNLERNGCAAELIDKDAFNYKFYNSATLVFDILCYSSETDEKMVLLSDLKPK